MKFHGWLAALPVALAAPTQAQDSPADRSIASMQQALAEGTTTSEALTREYLRRIVALDRQGPQLQAVIATNPEAIGQAQQLDRERRARKLRGPLHGIPILLKDNIESADPMPTTAGSLALVGNMTGRDAPIVANLRAAGALILGKANLSEWANFRSDRSISGWSAIGGLTRNPHVLDRSPCGSSAGSAVAVAAGLVPLSIGTETDGSIVCPAAMNGIVGLKPTLGLLSGARIVPIAHSQDTAGPMARSVSDLAVVLDALVGDGSECQARGCPRVKYAAALSVATIEAKRVGVWRFAAGRWPQIDPLYAQALTHLRAAGATLIEIAVPDTTAINAAERIVLNTEFKSDLAAYLANTPATVAARDLGQIIAFNRGEPREMALFAQEIFERSQAGKGLEDPAYRTALADSKRLAGEEGIARLLREHSLDFIVAPTTGPAWRIDLVNGDQFPGSFSTLPAVSGYPHLTVPMGTLQELPIGLSFIGPPWSEAQLLAAAVVFEQRRGEPPRPRFLPSIDEEDPRTRALHRP